ncbi:MAG: hypothetical protein AAB131_05725, partial [Actinomycetota bacterium]
MTAFQAQVNLVDSYSNICTDYGVGDPLQDTNPPADMPIVKVTMPGDPLISAGTPAAQGLFRGQRAFSIFAKTAISTYTVVSSTDSSSPFSYSAGTSTVLWTLPATADHFHFTSVPATKVAGEQFTVGVIAHDGWHNVLSTGPNAYRGTVQFAAENFGGIQAPAFSPTTVVFSSSVDQGFKLMTNLATLKKAGNRWIQAFDVNTPTIASDLNPAVNGPFIAITAAAPDSVGVLPGADTFVSAGSIVPNDPGFIEFTGQLTDPYNNPIINVQTVEVQRVSVNGTPGGLAWKNGATWVQVGASTQVYTDAQGRVGVANKLAYFVSSKKDDSARVWLGTVTAPADLTNFINSPPDSVTGEKKNITGALVTAGGLATKLVFTSTPTQGLVGINDVAGAGAAYIMERRDDFNNSTKQGDTPVTLTVTATQKTIHEANGMSLGLSGNSADFGYRNRTNTAFINLITIFDGLTGTEPSSQFRYHDRMSSYSGGGPSSNTAESGRPGAWTIQASVDGVVLATHELRVDPDVIDRVGFANSTYSLVAGKTVDFGAGTVGVFKPQLQDQFRNPRIAAQAYTVTLATVTRASSALNDYVAFSSSPDNIPGGRTLAPIFNSSTGTVTIPIDAYQTTFYYLDTNASSRYAVGGATKPIISIAVNGLFSASQSVVILSDVIDRIAVTTGTGQTLGAGVPSSAFYLETQDYYGNASPLRAGQDPGGSGVVSFNLDSTSNGQVQFSTPNASNFKPAPSKAYLAVGQSATSFFLIDTKLSAPTFQVRVDGLSYPAWAPGISTYTVTSGPPSQLGWVTPSRRLIAGTTIQYVAGVATNSVIIANLLDQYGNVATSASTFTIRYNSPTTQDLYGGIDKTSVILATAPSAFWRPLFGGNLDVLIPGDAGLSQAPFYLWGRLAGGATVQAQAYLGGLPVFSPIVQTHQITPGSAVYLTVHHPFTLSNPLPVSTGRPLTIKARDLFGNVVTGDAVNGNAFTGPVNFQSSGSSATVILVDLTNSATYHIFTPGEAGVFVNLGLVDTIVELNDLKVMATSYFNPNIYGYTGDGARTGLPNDPLLRSDPDVVMSGVLVTPTDFAPESNPSPNGPIPAAKQAVGVNKRSLNQGDGTTQNAQDPVPMLMLDMRVLPAGQALTATIAGLRVQSRAEGNFDNNKITEVGLWLDSPSSPNGRFEALDDVFVGSGAYNNAGAWFFGNMAIGGQAPLNTLPNPVGANMTIGTGQSRFLFLTVRVSSSGYSVGELPARFG